MKMTPSRSCSHHTIKSDTLRSCDLKLNQMDQDNEKETTPYYNTLPNQYTHYDIPPNNSSHSNTLGTNYYDTPRSHKQVLNN